MRLFIICRSASSTTDSDELKRIKYLINDVQENVDDLREKNCDNLESMRTALTELQSKFDQMETRYNQSLKNMDGVSSIDISPTSLFFAICL